MLAEQIRELVLEYQAEVSGGVELAQMDEETRGMWHKRLFASLNQIGSFATREARLCFLTRIFDKPVNTSDDLNFCEVQALIAAINSDRLRNKLLAIQGDCNELFAKPTKKRRSQKRVVEAARELGDEGWTPALSGMWEGFLRGYDAATRDRTKGQGT